jgi:hypothetical protein
MKIGWWRRASVAATALVTTTSDNTALWNDTVVRDVHHLPVPRCQRCRRLDRLN